jgi:hypothetical protein
MRKAPMWSMFEGVAPTLDYDAAVMGEDLVVPTNLARRVTVLALVMNGDASLPFMSTTAKALANAIPNGQLRTLEGQRHDVDVQVLAPVLIEFFGKGK